MEVYHRGFLNEQKLYFQETKPAAAAEQGEWDEFHSLVKQYEENCELHRTQLDLAGDLVDECERHAIPVDAYALDGAFLDIELMDKIESYGGDWVTRLAKNRHIAWPHLQFQLSFITICCAASRSNKRSNFVNYNALTTDIH